MQRDEVVTGTTGRKSDEKKDDEYEEILLHLFKSQNI